MLTSVAVEPASLVAKHVNFPLSTSGLKELTDNLFASQVMWEEVKPSPICC